MPKDFSYSNFKLIILHFNFFVIGSQSFKRVYLRRTFFNLVERFDRNLSARSAAYSRCYFFSELLSLRTNAELFFYPIRLFLCHYVIVTKYFLYISKISFWNKNSLNKHENIHRTYARDDEGLCSVSRLAGFFFKREDSPNYKPIFSLHRVSRLNQNEFFTVYIQWYPILLEEAFHMFMWSGVRESTKNKPHRERNSKHARTL